MTKCKSPGHKSLFVLLTCDQLLQTSTASHTHTQPAHTHAHTNRGRETQEDTHRWKQRHFLVKLSMLLCEPHYCTQVEYERTEQDQRRRLDVALFTQLDPQSRQMSPYKGADALWQKWDSGVITTGRQGRVQILSTGGPIRASYVATTQNVTTTWKVL